MLTRINTNNRHRTPALQVSLLVARRKALAACRACLRSGVPVERRTPSLLHSMSSLPQSVSTHALMVPLPAPAPAPALAVPEVPAAGVSTTLTLGCGGLLVGETAACQEWPAKLRPMPPELAGLCDSLRVSLQVRELAKGLPLPP